ITLSGSACNDYDYNRYSPIPRYLFSSEDRYMKGVVKYFNKYRDWSGQMRAAFRQFPAHWSSWVRIGESPEITDRVAAEYLTEARANMATWKVIAADYSRFCETYPLMDMNAAVEQIESVDFLRQHYEAILAKEDPDFADLPGLKRRRKALARLSKDWGIPFESFYTINFTRTELRYPMGFQSWYPPAMDPKYVDFLKVKEAYKNHMFTPGVADRWRDFAASKGFTGDLFPVLDTHTEELKTLWSEFKADVAPASRAVPYALRAVWYGFLTGSDDAQKLAGIGPADSFTVETYNRLAGTNHSQILDTPFPIPASYAPGIQKLWTTFIKDRYPLRLTRMTVTPELLARYHTFIEKEIKVLKVANPRRSRTRVRSG
ncbi:MAG: hypothetical protein ACYTGH_15775, partial [Planctomycetota bacterium]